MVFQGKDYGIERIGETKFDHIKLYLMLFPCDNIPGHEYYRGLIKYHRKERVLFYKRFHELAGRELGKNYGSEEAIKLINRILKDSKTKDRNKKMSLAYIKRIVKGRGKIDKSNGMRLYDFGAAAGLTRYEADQVLDNNMWLYLDHITTERGGRGNPFIIPDEKFEEFASLFLGTEEYGGINARNSERIEELNSKKLWENYERKHLKFSESGITTVSNSIPPKIRSLVYLYKFFSSKQKDKEWYKEAKRSLLGAYLNMSMEFENGAVVDTYPLREFLFDIRGVKNIREFVLKKIIEGKEKQFLNKLGKGVSFHILEKYGKFIEIHDKLATEAERESSIRSDKLRGLNKYNSTKQSIELDMNLNETKLHQNEEIPDEIDYANRIERKRNSGCASIPQEV